MDDKVIRVLREELVYRARKEIRELKGIRETKESKEPIRAYRDQ